MEQRIPLELLAPAKDLACGKAAIDHGADAVYIGAAHHGARQAAGNSLADIAELCDYAHQYGAKVYVTVNTIVYDEELSAIESLLRQLKQVAVDAVLVQDMAVLELCWEIGLTAHASTQTDNRTAEKVKWLSGIGFERVVLARELSIDQIRQIHQQVPDVELEAFVHGALCVSYSGICYASQHCFGRSANRGECAQFCRLPFRLEDKHGNVLIDRAHLLSLKDMCRIDFLEELAAAGVCSFKIEGRLKDAIYVKNVVAAYREALDRLIAKHPERYRHSSLGSVVHFFTPDLQKTFNRGYTSYGLHGREKDLWSPDTPKAVGQQVGRVKEIKGNSFTVATVQTFANGDGICFFDGRELHGFRVNRVEGNRLFPQQMSSGLKPDTVLYRNHDQAFAQQLDGKTAQRTIPLRIKARLEDDKLVLEMSCLERPDIQVNYVSQAQSFEPAQKSQAENQQRQLGKLGGTAFHAEQIELVPPLADTFIPSSILSAARRETVNRLQEELARSFSPRHSYRNLPPSTFHLPPSYTHHWYQYNVSNRQSARFYAAMGWQQPAKAFELGGAGSESKLIMQCRHCIKYELGGCSRQSNARKFDEPLSLVSADNTRYRLQFDCKQCQMNVYAE